MQLYIFGELRNYEALSASDVKEILENAKSIKKELQALSTDTILEIFQKVSDAWLDEEYIYRKKALEELPSRIGFSKPMIVEGINTMCSLLSRDGMSIRMNSDLEHRKYLDEWVYNEHFQGYMKAQPIGVVAHVSAGNVFVGGVDSLIQGIATKNINIMKMSSVDPIFPVLFAQSLKEFDTTGILHKAMALLTWKGGDEAIEKQIKHKCDAIVVYGGADTIRAYRKDLGLHTKLIEYGPKYSFMLVSEDALKEKGLEESASLIARDALMWEQSACSSPHVVYVEGHENAISLMHAISKAFEQYEELIPQGTVYGDEAVEITKVREMAKINKAMKKGDYAFSKKRLATVVYQDEKEFQTSCHNRTLFIKAVDKIEDVPSLVQEMGEYIQTVAILSNDERAKSIASTMASFGADRFVEIGRMAVRKHGTPHDGTRGLSELVRWVSLSRNNLEASWEVDSLWEMYNKDEDGFDYLPNSVRDSLTLERVKNIFEYAKEHSPLLKQRYEGLHVKDFASFQNVPLMLGSDYKEYLPPHGEGLLTASPDSGFIFSSGGTTGVPKVVYRTLEEQHFNTVRLGKGLALSVFGKGDVVGNLLFAGNMWASFVSFTQALEHTGCMILPIAGNHEISEIVNNLVTFKANAILSIPSVLMSVAEYIEKNNIELHIDKVSTGGEHLFKESREYLRKILGVKQFASTGYTTNDTGCIGYQCQYTTGGVHHVHEDLSYVEILDTVTNEPIAEYGKIGKIVVTNLQRKLMPTIRYEVGDLGRWIDGKCKCGRKTRLIELLGRSDDVLIIGGGNIHPEVISSVIYPYEKLSSHFQLIAEAKTHKDRLKVIIEAKEEGDFKRLEQEVKDKIYDVSKELKTMFNNSLIEDVEVNIVAPNTIKRNPRTGKIQLTVDSRS